MRPAPASVLAVTKLVLPLLLAQTLPGAAEAPPAERRGFTDAPVPGSGQSGHAGPARGPDMDAGPMNNTPFSGAPMPMGSGAHGHQHSPGDSRPGEPSTPSLSR